MALTYRKSQGTCSERLIEENKCLQSLQVDSDNGVSMDILKEDVDELVGVFKNHFLFLFFFLFKCIIGSITAFV